MEKVRGFEVAKGFEDKGINLPVRKTKFSAGYDVEAAEDLDDSLTACISQAPLFLRFRRNSWYDTTVVRICQQLFSKFSKFFLRSQNFRVYYFYTYNSSNMFNPILSLYKKQEHTENTVSNTLLLSELYFFAII